MSHDDEEYFTVESNTKIMKKRKRVFNNMHGSALRTSVHAWTCLLVQKTKYKQKHQTFTQDVLKIVTIIKIIIQKYWYQQVGQQFFCL